MGEQIEVQGEVYDVLMASDGSTLHLPIENLATWFMDTDSWCDINHTFHVTSHAHTHTHA